MLKKLCYVSELCGCRDHEEGPRHVVWKDGYQAGIEASLVNPQDRHLVGIAWQEQVFIDTRLPLD